MPTPPVLCIHGVCRNTVHAEYDRRRQTTITELGLVTAKQRRRQAEKPVDLARQGSGCTQPNRNEAEPRLETRKECRKDKRCWPLLPRDRKSATRLQGGGTEDHKAVPWKGQRRSQRRVHQREHTCRVITGSTHVDQRETKANVGAAWYVERSKKGVRAGM